MADSDNKKQSEQTPTWPGIPDSIAHRTSMKWMALESLRIVHSRLKQRGITSKVLLLTSMGPVEGYLLDIQQQYEQTVAADSVSNMDIPSAVVHVRSELLNVYGKKDDEIMAIDNGAIVRLQNAVLKIGGRKLRVNELALFASEVIGFTLVGNDTL